MVVARSESRLEETAALVRAAGAECLLVPVDLSKPESARRVVQRTFAEYEQIDALLNIAGAVPQSDLFDMTDEQWAIGMDLKLHGARRLTIAAWEALKDAKGSVVFMSGNSAATPKAGFAAVGTINAAVVALAKAFAERGARDGVQVNSVLPGPVMTDRRESFLKAWAFAHQTAVEAARDRFLAEAGVTRYGQPEEVAELMAFMVSPAGRWMTGSAVRMDGGEIKAV